MRPPLAHIPTEESGTVRVIDTGTGQVVRPLSPSEGAHAVAMRPDGTRVFASNGRDGTVMALTPDGKKLYVANGRSSSVSVIDAEALTAIGGVAVGDLPWGVEIN